MCNTNGLADIGKYIDACKYIDLLKFSLDAYDNTSAHMRPNRIFDTVVKAISATKSSGANISIVFTLHKKNYAYADRLVALARTLGVTCNFSILTTPKTGEREIALVFDDNEFESLYEKAKISEINVAIENGSMSSGFRCTSLCGAGSSTISISSNGNVYPCHLFNGNDEFLMGNALNGSIHDILKSKNNAFSCMSVNDLEQCKDCDVKYFCGGGCRFRGYADYGDIRGHDRMCKVNFTNIENTILKAISG